MATLKAEVQGKRKDGTYIVYVRVTHNRRNSYMHKKRLKLTIFEEKLVPLPTKCRLQGTKSRTADV